MKFTPIVAAIETMLSTDPSTKNLIAAYRQFTLPEPGTWITPLCVICPDLDIVPNIAGFGPTILRNRKVPLEIHLLERSYDVQERLKVAVTTMDTLQDAVGKVFEADPTLNETVVDSKIIRIQLQRYNEEYFEWVVTLSIDTELE